MAGIEDLNQEIARKKKNIVINGFLDLRGSTIMALPDGLTVNGNLFLSNTGITALPDYLTVNGSLYISGTAITTLPDTLSVSGCVNLSGTGITSLPDKPAIGGIVYGLEGNQQRLSDVKPDTAGPVISQALVRQCTEEIIAMWTTFYNIYDTNQKRNPLFKDQPLPLTFLIDQFVMEALTSVRARYPFVQPGPNSHLLDMVFEAISKSRTCAEADIKQARQKIYETYAA